VAPKSVHAHKCAAAKHSPLYLQWPGRVTIVHVVYNMIIHRWGKTRSCLEMVKLGNFLSLSESLLAQQVQVTVADWHICCSSQPCSIMEANNSQHNL
jgi:hypothetical protein